MLIEEGAMIPTEAQTVELARADAKDVLSTIEVPLEAFALLFAYCHTSQLAVPVAAQKHPDYPENRKGRYGHLTKTLRPYAEKAFAALEATDDQ